MFDPNSFLPFNGSMSPQVTAVFYVLVLWSLFWKLIGLYQSARHEQKVWFVAMFFINALGIVELVYLGFFQKGEPTIIEKLKKRNSSKRKS